MRLVKLECDDNAIVYLNPETVESIETEAGKHGSATIVRLTSGDQIAVKDPLELVVFKIASSTTIPEVKQN